MAAKGSWKAFYTEVDRRRANGKMRITAGKIRRNPKMNESRNLNICLAALDLDGTTLRSDGSLSDFNRQMLLNAHDAGIHIVVASGRAFGSLPEEVTELSCVEYAITSNGASVYEVKSRTRIQSHYLKKEAVRRLLHIAEDAGVMVEGFVDGIPYSQRDYVEDPMRFGASAYSVPYVKRTRRPVEDIFEFLLFHEKELDSLDLITGDMEQKAVLRSYIENEVKDIYLTSSVPTLLEISDVHAGKASGLQFLAEYLGIRQEETVAFGNAENDADMILWAGTGVAVANSPEDVRMAADEVTESNDKDGVGLWIQRNILKKV